MTATKSEVPIETFRWIRDKYQSKGRRSLLLEWRIEKVCTGYSRLTVRMLFYRLCARYQYPATKNFYKRVVYHSTKMRRVDAALAKKFQDPTRQTTIPPFSYKKVAVFFEKDSIRTFLAPLTLKYRLSTLTLRGYGSLTSFQKAHARAQRQGTELVLFIGDHDASGLDLQRAAETEMDHASGIRFIRIALTWEQVQRIRPPSRPVNMKDSRAKDYIEKYGNRCWEFEALAPRTAKKIVDAGFKKYLPNDFLEAAKRMELAVKAIRPVTEKYRRLLEREAFALANLGYSPENIRRELTKNMEPKYHDKKICSHTKKLQPNQT